MLRNLAKGAIYKFFRLHNSPYRDWTEQDICSSPGGTVFLLILLLTANLAQSAQGPSDQTCDYYSKLESNLQCGPENYLMDEAKPLCEYYLKVAPWTLQEIQVWFPKVRLCLQEELQKQENTLTCEIMNSVALRSHVDCYVKTGYCELSWASKAQLTMLTIHQALDPLWIESGKQILEACQSKSSTK